METLKMSYYFFLYITKHLKHVIQLTILLKIFIFFFIVNASISTRNMNSSIRLITQLIFSNIAQNRKYRALTNHYEDNYICTLYNVYFTVIMYVTYFR